MRDFRKIFMGTAAVAISAAAMMSSPANAQYAYGTGSTAAQVVYRELFDCWYLQALGGAGQHAPIPFKECTAQNESTFGGQILYAGTGSGNGKAAFIANSPSAISLPPSGSIPFLDLTNQPSITSAALYQGLEFAGTDVPFNATDLATYNSTVAANGFNQGGLTNPNNFGNVIQIPSVAIPIAIGYNKDGAGHALPAGLKLSRQALCGIVSGHITQWSNGIITAANGGTAVGSGQITFVHRVDASGSTFLVTNALATQCRYVTGPNNESDTTHTASYALPWTDRNAACPVPAVGSALAVGVGSDLVNWPDVSPDQCSQAITTPTGAVFANGSGSGAIVTAVTNTNGAIGYASADYWAPVKSGGLPVASLQNQYDVNHGSPLTTFVSPTSAGVASAVSEISPQFPGTTSIADPLQWGAQGVVPNPVLQASYPISGFTWLLMYQCYADHTSVLGTGGQTPGSAGGANFVNAFGWLRTWIDYLYSTTQGQTIVTDNGFANLPYNWLLPTYTLLTGSYGPAIKGTGQCSSFTGNGAY